MGKIVGYLRTAEVLRVLRVVQRTLAQWALLCDAFGARVLFRAPVQRPVFGFQSGAHGFK